MRTAIALLLVTLGVAGLVGCAKSAPGVTVKLVSGNSGATAAITGTPTLVASGTPDSTSAPSTSLTDFTKQYGDPPDANLGRLSIPSIGVDAPIGSRSVGADLDLSKLDPYGPTDVVWYDFGSNTQFGGAPGGGGNAIFAGHVDYNYIVHYANAHYYGPGVFAGISGLAVGDTISVQMNSSTTNFKVAWIQQVPETGDWNSIMSSHVAEGDSITLVTCGGDFDPVTVDYNSRTVVRAVRQ